ncbi:hypothetical protein [Pseudomonas sp. PS02290]|uniref:hypothetical protein n=1 Tax=Pseudomonas sp. PS02290 TaxID=2991430 RepID=UPI00249B9D73|nr:hypothetical protein [Pseudomonas sp. PS02290]
METNAGSSEPFGVGDFVCVRVNEDEYCGEVVDTNGALVLIDKNEGGQIWVDEKACYPG